MNLESFNKNHEELYYAVFRAIVGLMFLYHGAEKLGAFGDLNIAGFSQFAGIPLWASYIVAFTEIISGALIFFGFFAKIGAALGVIVVSVAYFKIHIPNGFNPLLNGGEPALLYLGCFILILVQGSKKYSFEHWIFGKEIL
ncbi:MAG TPA: DoxX family protein [Candidatus Nanoarchaeia archaeon]|nr:DoxX family protein [Candidatus Nanoarchaeia archaeon]